MRILSRLGAASGVLIALSACSGSTETVDGGAGSGSGSGSSFADASADCDGCEYAPQGLQRPNRLWVAAGYLYVEDWQAAKLVRLPLEGGTSEVVSEGVVPQTFALTETHLYFAAPDPIDDDSRIVYRVAHEGGQREQVVRYQDSGEIVVGLADEAVVLKGTAASGGATLVKVEPDGEKVTVREWPSASESPLSGCVSVLEDGDLIWCDREDGLWSASSLSADGTHMETGWLAGELDLTASGLLVASAPIGRHDIYLREPNGALVKIASSDEAIGSPRYHVGTGVVWIQGGVRFTDISGESRLLADSDGELSTTSEGITVSSAHVFFTGHRGSEPWSVYRIAIPR